MEVSTRIRSAVVALCLSVLVLLTGITQLPAPAVASPSPSDQTSSAAALWVVDDMHLARLPIEGGSADPQIVATIDSPSAIVADSTDALVWIYQKRQLAALDPQGHNVFQIDLSGAITEATKAVHVALLVDAQRRQLWLGLDQTLLHLDFSGRIQGKVHFDQPIQALALDPLHANVWVASGKNLVAYDATGTASRESTFQQPITAIAFDPNTDGLWVAAGTMVHRLAQDLSSLDVPVEGFAPSFLAPDGSGGIWLAGGASAEHLDRHGFVLVQSRMPTFEADATGKFTDAVVGLVADTLSGDAWIVGHRQVLQLGADGLVHPWFDARQWPQLHSILLIAPELTYTAAIGKPSSTNASVSAISASASSSNKQIPRSAPAVSQLVPTTASAPQPACIAPNTANCTTSTNVAEHIARMLWVSKQRDLYKVVPETAVASELAALQHAEALAVDGLHDVVWVYGNHTLVAFDATGKQLIDTTLPKNVHGDDHADLIVDGASGVEWLASGPQLYRFDQAGQWQATYPLDHAIQTLALDTKRHWLWAAEGKVLVALDPTGQKVATQPLHHEADALAYDASLDQLWLTVQDRLMRLASDGSTVLTAQLDHGSVGALAADGAGGVWVAGGRVLSHFDKTGAEQFALQPLSESAPKRLPQQDSSGSGLGRVLDTLSGLLHDDGNAHPITGMAADPLTHGVWVAGDQYLALIDPNANRTQWIDSGTWKTADSSGTDAPGQDGSGQQGIQGLALYVDTAPPVLTLVAPVTGSYTNKSRPTLSLHYSDVGSGVDPGSVQVKSDGTVVPVTCQSIADGASCTPNAAIADGTHTLSVVVDDYAGNASLPAIATVTVDTVPPTITLSSPTTQLTNQPDQTLAGSLSEKATLTVDNADVPVNAALQFNLPITLKEGSNAYTLTATDLAGNATTQTISITLDTTPPALPVLGLFSVAGPTNGQVTISGKAGSVEGGATVVLTDTVTGATVSVIAAADGSFTALLTASASDPISVWVMDGAGNVTKSPTPIQASSLPPDPATVAPKLLPTVATPFQDQVGFLYSGPQPIQTGVAAGAIAPLHVAVVRGQVFDRANQPLPGVTVTVLDHPEWGQTLTRADGRYDMAVNGGGSLVLNFSASGYLTAQRTVDAPWHDFTVADPLVMVVPDAVATPVAFGAGNVQVAQSSLQSGNTGVRQTTVLIPAGTTATAVMPDGHTLAVSTAHLRATEFTVGGTGPSAMPANLPATSAYTYAVNLSLDEAEAAGATSVQFSKPVPVYVSNYMNISAGTRVPAGYYDPQAGAWKGSLDGVVAKVLGVDAQGLAQLDLDGSGSPASATLLGQYGIDTAELATITKSFAVGQSFWRVPVNHFTDWDFNFGYNPQAGYLLPPPPQPKPNSAVPQRDSRDDHICSGCEIDAENQRVGETIPVVGTPYTLHYESSSPASLDTRTITFPVTTATPPAGTLLSSIQVTVDIAGRTVVQNFDPSIPNQTFRWTWDGINAYGQPIHSPTQATIYLAYIYKQSYGAFIDSTPGAGQHFAIPGNAPMTGYAHAGNTVAATRRWTETLTPEGASPLGADRWTLNVTHGYDSYRHILYKGDGTIRSAQDYGDAGKAINFAGQGGTNIGATGNGGPATQATLWDPAVVKAAPDGSVYIWDSAEYCIRKVDPQGIISTFAGTCGTTGGSPFSSTPILATNAVLRSGEENMAVDADGNVYINVQNGIVRITPDGMGVLIAGGGTQNLVDGQPSTGAYVNGLFVVAPDKTIYFVNDNYHFGPTLLWKIDPANTLHIALGNGIGEYGIRGLALAKNGNVVFGDDTALGGEIKEVTPLGQVIKLAGYGPNGGPRISPNPTLAFGTYLRGTGGLVAGPDGSYYLLADGEIDRLDPQGWIRCVVGCSNVRYGGNAPFPEGGLPAQSVIARTCCGFNSIDIGPDGSIYLPELYDARVLRIVPVLPQVSVGDSLVASRSGRQMYVFDGGGQHIETLDAVTGNSIHTFQYDTSGLLSSLTDAEGRITTIKRDAQGHPTTIVAPDGQTTGLSVDVQQHLTAVADPAGNTYAMAYDSPAGQLTQFTNPRGFSDQYAYDANGQLVTNVNAGGGGWTLTRTGATDQSAPYTVTMQSAMGRTYSYAVSTQSDGSNLDLATAPDGTQSSLVTTQGGQRTTTAADGTVATVLQSADPRFGMQAPVDGSTTIKTPSGLTWSASQTRSAPLQSASNLLSFTSLQETSTINGNKTTRQYDPQAKTWTTTLPSGRTVATSVDSLDRLVSVSVPGMAKISLTYDNAGRPLSVSASDGTATRAMSYVYYPDGPQKGWLQSATDPLGRTVSYQYDAAGRITTKVLPDGRQIDFGYDADGNLTSVTPPGRPAHGFAYTPLDKTASYTSPLVPGVSTSATQYQYDKDRQLTQIVRPDGATLDYGYDTGGRLSTVSTPTGSYQYSYDTKSGKQTSILAPGNEALSFSWDGFLQTGVSWSGTVNGSVSRTYDSNFRMSGMAVNGQNIAYAYDADGLLTTAGELAVSHDPGNGHVTGTTMGNLQTALSYNSFGDVAHLQASAAGTALYDVAYQRDALGRITQRVETTMGVTQTFDYAYDTQGRLADVKLNGLDQGAYGYDANGNRTQVGGQTVATYDDQDRLLTWGSNTYTYDANGALTGKTTTAGTTSYTYDELGNLRDVKLPGGMDIQYVIDGQNRRIGKKVNGVLVQGFLYQDALKPVAELDGQGNIVSRFVYGTRVNVPDYMLKGGKTYRILKDLLGSPRLVVDTSTGQVVQAMDYDAWGRVIQDTNPGFQPFGFAGGLYDRDTGLIRFGARDYDPETGRWTAKDPLGFGGGDADLYAYVGGDPLNNYDPYGLIQWPPDIFSQGFVDGVAGFGDGISLGLTAHIRQKANIDAVDYCDSAYSASKTAGHVYDVALVGVGSVAAAPYVAPYIPSAANLLRAGALAASIHTADPADIEAAFGPITDVVEQLQAYAEAAQGEAEIAEAAAGAQEQLPPH
ncbi:MAG: RHS repeat-associated core domain-containing protein [Rhodanobacter sp.]